MVSMYKKGTSTYKNQNVVTVIRVLKCLKAARYMNIESLSFLLEYATDAL